MNPRTLIAGVAAGLVALGAFLGIRFMFAGSDDAPPPPPPAPVAAAPAPAAEPDAAPPPEPEPPAFPVVLVATRDIQPGVRLVRQLVAWREWRGSLDVNTALVENITPIDAVLGTVARTRIREGDPIEWSNVILPGQSRIHDLHAHAGASRRDHRSGTKQHPRANIIRPGDRVDIILVSKSGDVPPLRDFGPAALTIARDVLVLAVGSMTLAAASYQFAQSQGVEGVVERLIQEQPDGDTYTLEVAPEDAERVALASGMVMLTLRSFRDPADDEIEARLVGFDDVLGGLADPDPLPPVPAVRIIRGRTAEVEELAALRSIAAAAEESTQ